MDMVELIGWMIHDEMMGIFRQIKEADPSLPDHAILEMVAEDQEARGWIGRIK